MQNLGFPSRRINKATQKNLLEIRPSNAIPPFRDWEKRGTSRKQFGNRKPTPGLFFCPHPSPCLPPKCEYTFIHPSHSHPNTLTANTDAFYGFTAFSFRWIIYLKCCLAALSSSPCTASEIASADPNLSGDGRQARSLVPDGARLRVRVGAK